MNNTTTMAELIALIELKWLISILISLIVISVTIFIYLDTKKTKNKARQIDEIEKQLEKLYYPLLNILKNPRANLRIDEKRYSFDFKKINEIRPFQHLASDDLKDLIEEFIKNALVERSIDTDNRVDGTNFDITYESFIELVEADIKWLKKELQSIKNS